MSRRIPCFISGTNASIPAWFLCIFAFLSILPTAVLGQEEIKVRKPKKSDGEIRWKLKKDQKYDITVTQDVKITMKIQGREIKNSVFSKNVVTMTIKSSPKNGTVNAETKIKRITMSLDQFGRKFEFDSGDPKKQNKLLMASFEPALNATFPHKFDKQGKAFDEKVDSKIVSKMKTQNAQFSSSKAIFQELAAKSHVAFPKGLTVGKKWTDSKKSKFSGQHTTIFKSDYQYLGVTEKNGKPFHVVKGKVTMEFENEGATPVNKVNRQDSTITHFFDGRNGMLDHSVFIQDVQLATETPQGEITQDLKQTMKHKFVRLKK